MRVEVAGEAAREYADGVWLVALEALPEGAQVAGADRVRAGAARRSRASLALESLTDHLRAKRLLLVLDNCEHLLEASAQVAGHLLRECAGVRILATSREALGITGETAWAVPALAVPDPAHLPAGRADPGAGADGLRERAALCRAGAGRAEDFALTGDNALAVAQVCARLEGIPLAIELAAARVRAMTVEQIAARLDDHLGLLTGGSRAAPSRQQTLRATLDWSYALLSEPERLLLARLSVFAGGWTLEAAEGVCAGDGIEAAAGSGPADESGGQVAGRVRGAAGAESGGATACWRRCGSTRRSGWGQAGRRRASGRGTGTTSWRWRRRPSRS